jgi:hypothetical protein
MRIKLHMFFGQCSISDGLFHRKAIVFLANAPLFNVGQSSGFLLIPDKGIIMKDS